VTIVDNVCCSGLGWLRGTVVERRSVTGELSLSYARPAAYVGKWSATRTAN